MFVFSLSTLIYQFLNSASKTKEKRKKKFDSTTTNLPTLHITI